ncbi:ABC transporter permease [Clostridium amazonitimonense]|uniref:ABC transporter permease n=1 Tax=Clostridium amazonitimonense TaxID=1499689 RepID=UPI00050994B3|nr:FtsX-like permease family protein [Clostridium amazonitimonense]
MKSYNEITLRYLKGNKKRTILTIIGIILAVSLFSGIGTFFYSLNDGLIEEERKNTGNFEVIYSKVKGEKLKTLSSNFEILDFGISKDSTDIFNIKGFDEEYKIYLFYYNSKAFYDTFNGKLVDGEEPKNQDEIIIGKKSSKRLDKNLGDYINLKLENRESRYKIVGYYDDNEDAPTKNYIAITFINESYIDKDENYSVYANLKEKKDKRGVGKKVGNSIGLSEEDIRFNDGLLRLMLQDKNQLFNDSMYKMLAVILSIIVICTVAVIYNSFNISVAERINQFGILRCIGATPSKIRRLVFKEGFIMCIIAIPIGIIAGYLGIYTTIKLMNKSEFFIFNFSKVGFYPQVLVISIVLSVLTVILSVMGPAITASKIAPIEAVRNSAKLKKEKFKRRNPRFTRLLFGIEGAVAYKNIRRNNKRFLITVFSLTVSLVMFVVFTSLARLSKDVGNQFFIDMPVEATIESYEALNKDMIKDIEEKDEIKEIVSPITKKGDLYVEDSYLREEYYKNTGVPKPETYNIGGKNYAALKEVSYGSYDSISLEEIKKHIIEGKIDEKDLNNEGVVLIDRNIVVNQNKETGQKVIENITKYKVGDKIRIPKVEHTFQGEENSEGDSIDFEKENREAIEKNNFIEATIVAIADRDPFNKKLSHNSINLIFSRDYFKKSFGDYPIKNLGLRFKDRVARDNVYEYLENLSEEYGVEYVDVYSLKEKTEGASKQIYVFIYGFIIIVTTIALVNIINTITTGLLLRKNEFATLSAIGMTKSQLEKMLALEGILYGIITSIFGTVISYGLYKLLLKSSSAFVEINTKLPIDIFLIGAIAIILITLIASMIPLRKLKNMNIVENIRAQE